MMGLDATYVRIERTPRGSPARRSVYQDTLSQSPYSIGASSDLTMWATPVAKSSSSTGRPRTSPGKGYGKGQHDGEFDFFIASAMDYLKSAERSEPSPYSTRNTELLCATPLTPGSSTVFPCASPDKEYAKGHDQVNDSFNSSSFSCIDHAERSGSPPVRPLHFDQDASREEVASPGMRPLHFKFINESPSKPPAVKTRAGRAAKGRPPGVSESALLQRTQQIMAELHAGGESYGGPEGQWGCILCLLNSCPSIERNQLVLKALTCAAPFAEVGPHLTRSVVEDEVRRAESASSLVSANGLLAALVHSVLFVEGQSGFLDAELSVLIRDVKAISHHLGGVAVSVAMHQALAEFVATLSDNAREGAGDGCLPECLRTLCHYVYEATTDVFGILVAQNSIALLLTKLVITPSLLRVAKRPDLGGVCGRVSQLSRLLHIVGRLAHHDAAGAQGGRCAEDVLIRHASELRGLVSGLLDDWGVLSYPTLGVKVLCLEPTIGLKISAQAAEEAAKWIVTASRRWCAPSSEYWQQDSGPLSKQLAAASRRLAHLHAPSVMDGITARPKRIGLVERSNHLDTEHVRVNAVRAAYNK